MSFAEASEKVATPEMGYGIEFWIGLFALFVVWTLLMAGMPVPVGYDRGKVKFLSWCGTGKHFHTVYRTENGFQTLHPKERDSA